MQDEERQQQVLAAIYQQRELKGKDMLPNLLGFGRVLKSIGMDVTVAGILEVCRALEYLELDDRESFFALLEASFVRSPGELELFRFAFDQFWVAGVPEKSEEEVISREKTVFTPDGVAGEQRQEDWQPGYSAEPIWQEKDFEQLDENEIEAMMVLVEDMVRKLSLKKTRRFKTGHRGQLDWRKTFKSNLRRGGELLDLKWKRRKEKKAKLVVLCDVSGSMENYSRFLLEFVFAMQQAVSQVESFVFSTSLTRITHLLKQVGAEQALRQLKGLAFDWAGGTDIGRSLAEFNRNYAPNIFTGRTIVIIICDGWDRGDVDVLASQMAVLQRRAAKLIWLNPLAGSPDYEPTCKGMAAALPYTDVFSAFHNFHSLEYLGEMLPSYLEG